MKLAVNFVTVSNVFMSDNPDTIYSYSGIYDIPVVFERNIKYSDDFAVTADSTVLSKTYYRIISCLSCILSML